MPIILKTELGQIRFQLDRLPVIAAQAHGIRDFKGGIMGGNPKTHTNHQRGDATANAVSNITSNTSTMTTGNATLRSSASHAWQACVALLATVAMALGMACVAPTATAADSTTTWSSLSADLKRSTYGFFLWRSENGATQNERDTAKDAANILLNSTLPKTKITGKAGSATSLDNAIKAAKGLVKINEYRLTLTNEPCRTDLAEGKGRACSDPLRKLTPYLTSDTLMAITQVNADFSDTVLNHAANEGQSIASQYNVGTYENIAWGWDTLDSDTTPMAASAWYSEKSAYDAGTTDFSQIGHYTTLTNKSGYGEYQNFTVAGFGFNTVGTKYGATEVLDCLPEATWNAYSGYTQTAASYVADLEAYEKLVPTIVSVQNPADVTTKSGTAPVLPATVKATLSSGSVIDVPVTWNTYDPSNYKTLNASSFTVDGTVPNWSKKVTVKVNVTAATVTTVASSAVSTTEGVAPKLPSSVTTCFSNGQCMAQAVTWPAIDASKYANPGSFTVTGKLTKYPSTAAYVLVTVKAATITSVANPTDVNTVEGMAPKLPSTVKATLNNGKTKDVAVTWAAVLPTSYAKAGTSFTVKGTVAGYANPVTVTVKVVAPTITSIDTVAVATTSGTKPVLPSKVTAHYNNGTTKLVAVTWGSIDAAKYNVRKGGTFTVNGTVSGTSIKAVAKVTVAPAVAKSATTTVKVTTTAGTAPTLPATLQVTWSNGDTTNEPVTWNAVAASSYAKKGTFTVNGKFTDTALAARFGTLAATVTVNAIAEQKMYRLYNPNSGEHFYTAAVAEHNNLVNLGWHDEGIGWVAPVKSGTPVYRLYNPNAGDHHYTMSAAERDYLVKAGWNDEGIGWYSAENAGRAPLYRQYNPNAKAGAHNFTLSLAERDNLVSLGWHDEGTAWYAVRGLQ